MYLLVFAFLIIGLLGIYTQVFAIEVSRMAAGQTATAQSMILWHEAATSLAGNVMNPNSQRPPWRNKGCSLTADLRISGAGFCQLGVGVSGASDVTVTGNGTYSNASTTFPQLAPNFNSAAYEWKSVAFQTNGYYVITFVEAPNITASNPPPGFISTASGQQLTLSESDLLQQLRHTDIPTANYGWVTGGTLITAATLPSGVQVTYTNLPNTIPDGAVAIISAPGICKGC